MARADELAGRLVPYLRHALGALLELDGAVEPLAGGFDTEVHAFRLRDRLLARAARVTGLAASLP